MDFFNDAVRAAPVKWQQESMGFIFANSNYIRHVIYQLHQTDARSVKYDNAHS